jgi:type IX secretion system PorP/SprF family membrane protein
MCIFYRYMVLLLVTLSVSGSSFAQEDPTTQQYMFNLLNINPAYAGSRGMFSMTTAFRRQWTSIPGAPQTAIFSADAPINEHHLGIGMQLYSSSIGIERTNGLNMSFASMIHFDEEQFLSLGIQAGLMNYRVDRTSVALPYQNDPAFQTNTNVIMPTAGLGIYYQGTGMYASLSAPSLLVSTVKVNHILSINSPTLSNLQVMLTAGMTADLGDNFQLKPSVYMRWMSGKVFDVHLNSSLWIKNIIGIGASYRFDDAILGTFEFALSDKFSFGYSYGKSIADRGVFNQGTHEAIIRLNLSPKE